MPAVYDNFLNKAKKYYEAARNKDKEAQNKIFDEQEKVVNDTYNKAVKDTKISYDDRHRENAIQKLINQNEIAEDMANMGLSDSGLNRTQQTAVQLSYANNKSSIDRQKQAQLDSFAQSLAAELSTIEQNRISSIAAIDQQYDSAAVSAAQDAYQSALDAETARVKSYYSNSSSNSGNQAQPFILSWNGLTETDEYGNIVNHIYTDSSGKQYKAKVGYNPYTDSNNAGSKRASTYGFFKNGYQPKGIVDIDGTDYGELENTGIPSYLTGKKQNIWSSTDKNGKEHLWLWSGSENAYVEMKYNSKTDEYKTTAHKVYF